MSEQNNNQTLPTDTQTLTDDGWYIVCCQVGKELIAKKLLEEKIKTNPEIGSKIFEILVPEEEEIQIRKSEKTKVRKAVYKGYIYIHMKLDADTYNFVRSVNGIKGFLGGSNPQKMSKKEVNSLKILAEKLKGSAPKIVRKFDVGDTVRIIEGPLKHSTGVVEEINEEKGKLKVSLTFFGRQTVIELEFTQVEKV
ncbi:MAG: transcription termination/antitermination protein NusG [Endomicrobia bacterium]|nr:transcription termination/antitermination protein NusG [Endomicrobiia bacterium]